MSSVPSVTIRERPDDSNEDDAVMVDMPPATERRCISEISITSRTRLAGEEVRQSGRSARSRSPRKKLVSGPGDTVEPAEQNHNNETDDLNRVLLHPFHLQLQAELEEARKQRAKLEDDIFAKSTELAERESELAEVRKGWRKVGSELNKIRAKGQGFYQVTDQYLIDKAGSLRYSIRNFAIQYFEGEMKRTATLRLTKYYEFYVEPTTPDPTVLDDFLRSPSRCPSLIQAIFWRVLHGAVFDQFRWAGEIEKHAYALSRDLRPKQSPQNRRPDPEAERKFQTWKAMTTSLLMDLVDLNEGGEAYKQLESRKSTICDHLCDVIEPFARHVDEGFKFEIVKIVGDAIVLDKEICKQVARVEWIFERGNFDPSSMTLEGGEKLKAGREEIQLVVAPGLKKRGKSNGDDFKLENRLLRAEVSCEPIRLPSERSFIQKILS